MALLSSSPSLSITSPTYRYYPSRRLCFYPISATHVVTLHHIDKSSLTISETSSEDQLWAAACLRDHKRYLAEREFEALKERIAGKRTGFNRVSCLNASLPLSQFLSLPDDDLCAQCKFSENGEDRVVVGTLDVNQCMSLPDEITGMKPQGIEGQFARGYLSNVCVANELHRNGLGYDLVAKSKAVAQKWGITDLYVHVAVNNEPAKQLYMKSGFVYENDEPAWQARFLDRPRRLLLWLGLPGNQNW
ncbi:GCN5-related N-acetyltransferase 7, chloroplastic isoform X2 [Populus nigra]|uniref:GCN5-related N-acetyltransferase 7, chloroplastic isoform X2 n=1 Tax=Populus nigra TaxID=3691 RepID=UPI002B2759A7|nr:GCN5-related N-acetyltransferase 7, chloroplastic isoform X2 [Populus nigra]